VARGVGDREQIRQYRPGVPERVAVGALAVFPGVAPPLGGGDDGDGRLGDGGIVAGGVREESAIVALPEHVEAVGFGVEVVDAGAIGAAVAGDEVEVDVVEFARAGRRTERGRLAPNFEFFRHPGGVVGEGAEVRAAVGCRCVTWWVGVVGRDRFERGIVGWVEVAIGRHAGEVDVAFGRAGLVLEVELERPFAEALAGVVRALVVLAGVDHASRFECMRVTPLGGT